MSTQSSGPPAKQSVTGPGDGPNPLVEAKEVPPTVLSVQIQKAIDSYVPSPSGIGPSLASHIAKEVTAWLQSSPYGPGDGGTPARQATEGGSPK